MKITFNQYQRGTISSAPVGETVLVEIKKDIDFRTAIVGCCATLKFTVAVFFSPKWS